MSKRLIQSPATRCGIDSSEEITRCGIDSSEYIDQKMKLGNQECPVQDFVLLVKELVSSPKAELGDSHSPANERTPTTQWRAALRESHMEHPLHQMWFRPSGQESQV